MEQKWTTVIKAKTGYFDFDLKELIQYKDLIGLFVKRNYATRYKQTILGPLWLILNPMITVLLYSLVFGGIAGLSTDGSPTLLFYLASNSIWSYFSLCLSQTSNTFNLNVAVFGKVYFPRLTAPISTVITGFLDLSIQVIMLIVGLIIYNFKGIGTGSLYFVWLIPIIAIQMALLSLGCGIIISSLTTKYKDLAVVVTFGIQLWMYVSPVVYSISQIPERYRDIYMLNPIAPIISIWRYAFLGVGDIPWRMWGVSWVITIAVLIIGVCMFSKIEKTFMDTI